MNIDDLPSLDQLDEALDALPVSHLPMSDAAVEAYLLEDTRGEPIEDAAEIEKIFGL